MRIKTACRCCHEVNRWLCRAFMVRQGRGVRFNPLNELWIGWAQIGTTGACGIVTVFSSGRWPTVKIPIAGKTLADQVGADDCAVLFDKAATGFRRKDRLGDAGHAERIE